MLVVAGPPFSMGLLDTSSSRHDELLRCRIFQDNPKALGLF
jgi:hypothetical protein